MHASRHSCIYAFMYSPLSVPQLLREVLRTCLRAFVPSCFFVFFFLSSCKKEPGEGGKATIQGKLYAGNYYSPSVPVASDDIMADEHVYITYGTESDIANNDVKTGYDGSFIFKYLRTGKYRIYAYSLDTSNPSPSVFPAVKEIEITKKDQVVDVTGFIVYKEADDNGSSSVKGKVYYRNYDLYFTTLLSEGNAPDEDVYILFGNNIVYNDRIKSNYDGTLEFQNLRKGFYTIFVYSDDSAAVKQGISNPPPIAVSRSFSITSNNSVTDIGTLVILK